MGTQSQFWVQNPVLNWVEGGLLGHRGRLDRWAAPLLNNLFNVACAFGVLGLLSSSNGILRMVTANRPIQAFGMMCYSIYVWHGVLVSRAGLLRPGGYELKTIGIYFAWVATISVLSCRYIEFGHVRETRKLFLPRPGS